MPSAGDQVPLLVGTAAVSAIRGLRHHKSKKKAAGKPPAIANGNSAAPNGVTKQQVLLTWDRIHCAITDKKGQEKVILNDVSGQAEPGRSEHLVPCPCAHARAAPASSQCS